MDKKRVSKWFVILLFALSALTGCYVHAGWHHHHHGYYYDGDGWYYRR